MGLLKFFQINLPYGIVRNDKSEWSCINREYMPLGYNDTEYTRDSFPENHFHELPIYTPYKGLTEKTLLKLAETEERLKRNDKGEIIAVWFYNDGTNPANGNDDKALWDKYFDKLKILSKLQRKREFD